jgi:hypothetical protein
MVISPISETRNHDPRSVFPIIAVVMVMMVVVVVLYKQLGKLNVRRTSSLIDCL